MDSKLVEVEKVEIGQKIKSFGKLVTVVFIRRHEGDFQKRGYFVFEYENGDAIPMTVYKGEKILVFANG